MLYATHIINNNNCSFTGYNIFDTCTLSSCKCSNADIKKILQVEKIVNLRLVNGRIKLNKWPRDIENSLALPEVRENAFILLAAEARGCYRVLNYNNDVLYVGESDLISRVKHNQILNCTYNNKTNHIEYYDTYKNDIDYKFGMHIRKEYSKFIAKTHLVGLDCTFKYIIENNNVILTEYTGRSNMPIIPNFVQYIRQYAFYDSKLESITLNEGLLGIGDFVLNIPNVDIPKSVRFIGKRSLMSGNSMKIITHAELRF